MNCFFFFTSNSSSQHLQLTKQKTKALLQLVITSNSSSIFNDICLLQSILQQYCAYLLRSSSATHLALSINYIFPNKLLMYLGPICYQISQQICRICTSSAPPHYSSTKQRSLPFTKSRF